IQCYQCEEAGHDCSTPNHVVNCTVNVQDTCQQEVLVKTDGVFYRKSSNRCAMGHAGGGASHRPPPAPPPASGAPPPPAGSSHSS
ncbi:hypothetical protein NHX12_014637, partial [Muraenolepis orangiensis]